MPEIPKDDTQSDLYATLDGGSDSDDDDNLDLDPMPGPSTAQRSNLPFSKEHPYAKVKKSKLEHPYATVMKTTQKHQVPQATEVGFEDDVDSNRLHQPRVNHSRSGSGRSSHPEATTHSGSRQATPLPPEPLAGAVGTSNNMQNPNMHFSGDSQDSSKGYTSITVREPVRHIQLTRPQAVDATYATVSETSDDMYAAIEDPTYIPTGTASQSNSDTYAVIDLPDESEVDLAPSGGGASAKPFHPYSKIDRGKKRGGPQQPPPGQQLPPTSSASSEGPRRIASHSALEDMYAKVRKRTSMGMEGDEPEIDHLPVGASAMHTSLHLGARPRMAPAFEEGSRRSKSEINYSDYEVALYDKEQSARDDAGYELLPGQGWKKQRFDSSNGGYETVPNGPSHGVGGGGSDKDPNYEQVPDYWRSSNSGGGYETLPERRDPAYEVVRNRVINSENDKTTDDYDIVDKKGEATDSEIGYETIPGATTRTNRLDYDPGYEELGQNPRSEPGYATVEEDSKLQQRSNQGFRLHNDSSPLPQTKQRSERMEVSEVDEDSVNSIDAGAHIFV